MRQRTTLLVCVSALVIGSAALPAAAGSQAQSQKALCKKIRAAITAGHTLDQIMGEFHTDAQQVAKCLQQRGRRRATKVKKHQSSRSAAKPETRGSSPTGKPSDTPQQRAPRPRRLGPIP